MFYAKYVPNETEWKLACPHSSLVGLFDGAATLPEVADMSTDEKKFNLWDGMPGLSLAKTAGYNDGTD